MYGVSYGALIQSHYLMNDDANVPYSGMVAYGAPFCPDEDLKNFEKHTFGLYNLALGLTMTSNAKSMIDDLARYTP